MVQEGQELMGMIRSRHCCFAFLRLRTFLEGPPHFFIGLEIDTTDPDESFAQDDVDDVDDAYTLTDFARALAVREPGGVYRGLTRRT